jgi:chromosome segregation ATPase
MDEFKNNLNQSASAEMTQLQENLAQAAGFLGDMQERSANEARRQEGIDVRMQLLVESLETASRNQGSQMETGSAQLRDLLGQIAGTMDSLNRSGQETLQQQLQEQSAQTARQVDVMLQRFNEAEERQQARVNASIESMGGILSESTTAQSKQLAEQQGSVNNAIEETLSKLATFMEEREANLQSGYQKLNTAQEALAQTLSSGANGLTKSAESLKSAIEQSTQCVREITTAQSRLSTMSDDLRLLEKQLSEGVNRSHSTAETYQKAVIQMGDSLAKQSQHFQSLQSGLDSVLQTIANNLEQYQSKITRGMTEVQQGNDENFRKASQVFGAAVSNLSENAENMSQAFEDAVARLALAGR